jgi:hypothetical protein
LGGRPTVWGTFFVKLRLAVSSIAVLASLGAAGAAHAATVGVSPARDCYRAGAKLAFFGNGYTPSSGVNITSDGDRINSQPVATNGAGAFAAELTVGIPSGERVKTYAATDIPNPSISASIPLRISATDVALSPRSGRPGRRMRIRARGFTTGRRLYAHVRRGRRYRKNIRIGRLRGACHKLRARRRLISSGAGPGTYRIQFDTRRRYSRRTAVRVRYDVVVFRTFRSNTAGAASVGERWIRVP